MKISKVKIQGFRTINNGFSCELKDLSIFVGRNNSGKSCVVRALNLFFNCGKSPDSFVPHIRINPTTKQKKRFSIIIGVWLSNIDEKLKRKYRQFLNSDGELPVRLFYFPKEHTIVYSCFERGTFSTTKGAGVIQSEIIGDINEFISLRVIPETRDLEREFKTELGHGFRALKEAAIKQAESRSNKEANSYKVFVQDLINKSVIERLNKNLGSVIPDNKVSSLSLESVTFSRVILNSIIDQLPIKAENIDSDNIDIDQMGAGFQSAILVALYRTVAQLEEKQLILCVEEPEIHLDSHSQRYCYQHWSEQIAENNDLNQIIITSHSAFLIDEASPDQLILVKRDRDGCTCTHQLTQKFIDQTDLIKLSTKSIGLHNTDIYFSSFVVLAEGDGDPCAIRGFLDLYLKKCRSRFKSLRLAGITVLDCGGKDGIRPIAKILRELEIPYLCVYDRDVIQKVDKNNEWKIDQNVVEKTYLNDISDSFKSLEDICFHYPYAKFESEVRACLKKGRQPSYPQGLNKVLKKNRMLCMRTEHETDVIDKNNMDIVSSLFQYPIDENRITKSDDDIVAELKAKNQKKVKKLYTTARLVDSTVDWANVPKVYAKNCIEIIEECEAAGIRI
jgi:putative ATP-dependent endonuclease of OLD family